MIMLCFYLFQCIKQKRNIKYLVINVTAVLNLPHSRDFSALTLLVGRQQKHPACKNWVMRCWHGYLSEARCKWFAYRSVDAIVIHHLLLH